MKLYIHVLGLPVPLPRADQGSLDVIARFSITAEPDSPFKHVWERLELRFKENYPAGRRNDWAIKKLTSSIDGVDYDIDVRDSVADVFEPGSEPHSWIVRVHRFHIDRETSIPYGSYLQVEGTRRDVVEARSEGIKRRRVEVERYGRALSQLSPDDPVPSAELSNLPVQPPRRDSDGFAIPNKPQQFSVASPDTVRRSPQSSTRILPRPFRGSRSETSQRDDQNEAENASERSKDAFLQTILDKSLSSSASRTSATDASATSSLQGTEHISSVAKTVIGPIHRGASQTLSSGQPWTTREKLQSSAPGSHQRSIGTKTKYTGRRQSGLVLDTVQRIQQDTLAPDILELSASVDSEGREGSSAMPKENAALETQIELPSQSVSPKAPISPSTTRSSHRWTPTETKILADQLVSSKTPASIAEQNLIPQRAQKGIAYKADQIQKTNLHRSVTLPVPPSISSKSTPARNPVTRVGDLQIDELYSSQPSQREDIVSWSLVDVKNIEKSLLKHVSMPRIRDRFFPNHPYDQVMAKVAEIRIKLRERKSKSRISKYRAARIKEENKMGGRSTSDGEKFHESEDDQLMAARLDNIDLERFAHKHFPRRDPESVKRRAKNLMHAALQKVDKQQRSGPARDEAILLAMAPALEKRIRARLADIRRIDRVEFDRQRALELEEKNAAIREEAEERRALLESNLKLERRRSALSIEEERSRLQHEQSLERSLQDHEAATRYHQQYDEWEKQRIAAVSVGGPIPSEPILPRGSSIGTGKSHHTASAGLVRAMVDLLQRSRSVNTLLTCQDLERGQLDLGRSGLSITSEELGEALPLDSSPTSLRCKGRQKTKPTIQEKQQTLLTFPRLKGKQRVREPDGDWNIPLIETVEDIQTGGLHEPLSSEAKTGTFRLGSPFNPSPHRNLLKSDTLNLALTVPESPQSPRSRASKTPPQSDRNSVEASETEGVDEAAAQLRREANAARTSANADVVNVEGMAIIISSAETSTDPEYEESEQDLEIVHETSSEEAHEHASDEEVKSAVRDNYVKEQVESEITAREQQDKRARHMFNKIQSHSTRLLGDMQSPLFKRGRGILESASPKNRSREESVDEEIIRFPGRVAPELDPPLQSQRQLPSSLRKLRSTMALGRTKDERRNYNSSELDRQTTQSSLGSLRPPFPSSGKVQSNSTTQSSDQDREVVKAGSRLTVRRSQEHPVEQQPALRRGSESSEKSQVLKDDGLGRPVPQRSDLESLDPVQKSRSPPQTRHTIGPMKRAIGSSLDHDLVDAAQTSPSKRRKTETRKLPDPRKYGLRGGDRSAMHVEIDASVISASQPVKQTSKKASSSPDVHRSRGRGILSDPVEGETLADGRKTKGTPATQADGKRKYATEGWDEMEQQAIRRFKVKKAEERRKEEENRAKEHEGRRTMRKFGLPVSPHESDSPLSEESDAPSSESDSDAIKGGK
ncbi:hypothetical protein ANO11243_005340 [Dothideomycetidae sp. 11243]|nr:hypothetical protein ANO11243_005340 [fungal sp. No.11243]